ncbi:hypothetical protein [Kitasatospora sp. NPDC001132]
MAWVRISDDFYDHPKFDAAGSLGIALWAAGLAWSNRNLTDGFIPRKTALRLLDFEDAAEAVSNADRNGVTNGPSNGYVTPEVARFVADRLVKAGLWEETEGGFAIHDYLDYQKSAAQITAERDKNAARQKAFRDRRGSAKGSSSRNADRNGVTNGPVTHAPNPNPNPTEEKRTTSSSSADGEPPADPPIRHDVERVCRALADAVAANGSRKPTITKAWRDAARLMLDKDGIALDDILGAIRWSQADEFWRSNVLSMPTLRKQYDRLRLAAQRGRPSNNLPAQTQGHLPGTDSRVAEHYDLMQQLLAEGGN